MKISKKILFEADRKLGDCLADKISTTVVTMYRAVPINVMRFYDMDYITLSKKFAIEHAESNYVYHEEPFHVIKANVLTSKVFEAYNPGEYFYHGTEQIGRIIYTAKGPNEYEKLSEKIILEAYSKDVFAKSIPARYGFIFRDVTNYISVQQKRDIINKLEYYRLKSGKGLPIIDINPAMLVATQDSVIDSKVKKYKSISHEIKELPFVVKLHGIYYILDGHHRIASMIGKGNEVIKVRIMDLDGKEWY